MEWGRAKTILILTFLFLNLLLGYQLWASQLGIFGINDGNSDQVKRVQDFLQNKGIVLKKEIPDAAPKVIEIDVAFKLRPDYARRMNLDPPIRTIGGEQAWQDAMKKLVVNFDDYRHDPSLSRKWVIVMNQMHDGLPMFEITLRLYMQEQQILTYEQSLVEVLPSPNRKPQPALAAYRAVKLLADRFLTEGDVITDIQLGYHGQIYNSDTQVLAPKWRVTLESGEVYYVHAINGEVE